MANIRFNASKKTTIILLVVLFLILGGAGGYLLWRVNQQDTVAPTDSEAGSDQVDNCCCDTLNVGGTGIRKCEYDCQKERRCVQPGQCGRAVRTCSNDQAKVCSTDADCCNQIGVCKPTSKVCANNKYKSCTKDSDCCLSSASCVTRGRTCTNDSGKSCSTDSDCCREFREVCKEGTEILKNGPKCTCTNKPYACLDVGLKFNIA